MKGMLPSGKEARSRNSQEMDNSMPTGIPGFWQPMDTLRDKNELERLWSSGTAEWKLWD